MDVDSLSVYISDFENLIKKNNFKKKWIYMKNFLFSFETIKIADATQNYRKLLKPTKFIANPCCLKGFWSHTKY